MKQVFKGDSRVKTVVEPIPIRSNREGRLRNPATQVAYAAGSEPALFLGRGYTGHEHLAWFGLVNMNARLYDPLLGRFLSPDPYVQMPDFTQNFNRYSYCLNNPLVYVDENGELFFFFLFFTKTGYEVQKFFLPIAVKVNLHSGSDVKGIGFDVSVGMPGILPISYRKHYGQTYYSRFYDNAFVGTEYRKGAEWSFGSLWGVDFSGTEFSSGDISQTTNMISIGNLHTNIKYENDYMFDIRLPGIPKADNGDRWRTAAAQINIGNFSMGTNLMTGDPETNEGRTFEPGTGIHEGKFVYNGPHANDYRFGSFYFGLGPFRFGTNNEMNRHIFQNIFAHDILTGGKSKHFQFMHNRPWKRYWYFGTGTGNTLW